MSIQNYWGLQGPACQAYGAHWFRDWCGGISTSSCRTWCALYILTSKCAERHNGMHFFDIATSKSDPKLRCFVHFDLDMCFAPQRRVIVHLSSGLLFDPPEPQIIGKNTVFCDFPTFSRTWIFFLLTLSLSSYLLFSSLTLPTSAFHLSILSEVWLLNFLRLLFIFHTSYTIIIIICIFIVLFLVLSLLFLLLLLLLYIYIYYTYIYIYQYYFLLYIKYLMLAKC